MPDNRLPFATDDAVATSVLDVLRNAKDHVVLVSPYNKFWDHLRDEIRLAVGRGVKLYAICRSGEENDDITWLGQVGATVYSVDRLHAKLFFNETTVLMTSMNLHESSAKNSKEVALRVDDREIASQLRSYVQDRLIKLGKQVSPAPVAEKPAGSLRRTVLQTTLKAVAEGLGNYQTSREKPAGRTRRPRKLPLAGTCIRCEASIPYDPDYPLCDDCYRSWNRYKDPDYREKHCHRCGVSSKTSYAKPLCYRCYQQVAG